MNSLLQRCMSCGADFSARRCWRCWPIAQQPPEPLTQDSVRRIVREEIQKALTEQRLTATWKPPV